MTCDVQSEARNQAGHFFSVENKLKRKPMLL
jgi:hypothetical protein